MSRHRLVKQLDLAEEMDDEAFDEDYGEEDMSPEDQAKLESATTEVFRRLGANTVIDKRDVKDALWNYYFDVDQSIAYLKEEQRKKEKAVDDPTLAPAMSALSIQSPSSQPQQSLQESVLFTSAPAPAKNKLAAKIAAAKAAKLAAKSPAAPATSASESVDAPTSSPITAEGGGASKEKKLSKLQLKMLASQAAKKGVPLPSAALPNPAVVEPPIPPADENPTTMHFVIPSSSLHSKLQAPPSGFASVMSSSPSRANAGDLLSRIEKALGRDSAVSTAGGRAFEGPSPDDIVLNARKGASLAVGAGSTVRRK
ncbi:hypothetical protein T439DRAFT_206400 [Meredithblackwellia eburnea MCA 4105]